jgi:hypothetical protein
MDFTVQLISLITLHRDWFLRVDPQALDSHCSQSGDIQFLVGGNNILHHQILY